MNTHVPPDGTPAACPYCDRTEPDEELLALHLGVVHADRVTAEERAAYEEAMAHEEAQLRLFRLQALGALVVLYFGFLLTYAVLG